MYVDVHDVESADCDQRLTLRFSLTHVIIWIDDFAKFTSTFQNSYWGINVVWKKCYIVVLLGMYLNILMLVQLDTTSYLIQLQEYEKYRPRQANTIPDVL